MAAVVVALLAVGSLGGDPPTLEDRAVSLEETIRCPSCSSQSVANSDAPSAEAVRVLIRERLEAGNSNEEIRDYVASSYPNGRELLLDPSGDGFGALVWALPVVAAIVAVAALVRRFGDWRPGTTDVTEEDRVLVAAAMTVDPQQTGVAGPTHPVPGQGPAGGGRRGRGGLAGDPKPGQVATADAQQPLADGPGDSMRQASARPGTQGAQSRRTVEPSEPAGDDEQGG